MIKKLLVLVLLGLPLLFIASGAESAIVNFDDLSTPDNSGGALWGTVPASYAGFTWTGWEVQENSSYKSVYNNTYNFPSTPNAAYNGGTGNATVTITSSGVFDFTSAYFWKWTQNNAGQSWSAMSLAVSAFLNDVQVGSTQTITLASSPASVNLGFSGIDEIRFTTAANKYWMMDNANMAPVPIPPTVWLLGSGLIGLVGLRRRFNK
jgi:hypothetical protein